MRTNQSLYMQLAVWKGKNNYLKKQALKSIWIVPLNWNCFSSYKISMAFQSPIKSITSLKSWKSSQKSEHLFLKTFHTHIWYISFSLVNSFLHVALNLMKWFSFKSLCWPLFTEERRRGMRAKRGGWHAVKGHRPGLTPRPTVIRTFGLCTSTCHSAICLTEWQVTEVADLLGSAINRDKGLCRGVDVLFCAL